MSTSGVFPLVTCADCKLPLGTERWVKIADRVYHGRCWDVMRSQTKLKNVRSADGALLCPKCDRPIRDGDGTVYRDAYAVHYACAPEPI